MKYAARQQIEPHDFPTRMADVTLKSCKEQIRANTRGRACARIAAQADAPPATTPDDQPETKLPTTNRCEPPVSNSPPTSAEPVAVPVAPPIAKTVPTDGPVQSLPEPQIAITVTGKGGRSKTCTCQLSAETAEALLSRPWEESAYRDVFDLLSTIAQIVTKGARTAAAPAASIGHASFNPPPRTAPPTPETGERVGKRASIFGARPAQSGGSGRR